METVTLASAIASSVQAISAVCTSAALDSAIVSQAQLASAIAPTVAFDSAIDLEEEE